jgi:hypothetical protein
MEATVQTDRILRTRLECFVFGFWFEFCRLQWTMTPEVRLYNDESPDHHFSLYQTTSPPLLVRFVFTTSSYSFKTGVESFQDGAHDKRTSDKDAYKFAEASLSQMYQYKSYR